MPLPQGYTIRPATHEDVDAVVAVYNAYDLQYSDVAFLTPAEVLNFWETVDMANDLWVVVHDASGEIIACEDIEINSDKARVDMDGVVHPAHMGQGIGSYLVERAEARIHTIMTERGWDECVVSAIINGQDAEGMALFNDNGYTRNKSDMHMQVKLAALPAEPQWAEGVTVRQFVQGQDDRAAYHVVEQAFAAISGHTERAQPYENWHQYNIARDDFDPSFWFVAEKDGEIVAVSLCPNDRETGWIRQLAVLPTHQRLGLGKALLLHSMRAFYQIGKTTVGLGVQSDNIRAKTLYESVGMTAQTVYDTYSKTVQLAMPVE